jgi:phosphoserine aminotransferase
MLCVEDYLRALDWAEGLGLPGLIARADESARHVWEFCDANDWIANLADEPATRSTTSVCLKFTEAGLPDDFAKRVAKRLEAEGVALDVASYRDAPAGLRIWCGSTVDPSDVAALMPWIDWAYQAERAAG